MIKLQEFSEKNHMRVVLGFANGQWRLLLSHDPIDGEGVDNKPSVMSHANVIENIKDLSQFPSDSCIDERVHDMKDYLKGKMDITKVNWMPLFFTQN